MKRLSENDVSRARAVPLLSALLKAGVYVSQDSAFKPRLNRKTAAVFVSDPGGQDVKELIITEDRWYDRRAKVGGGGAIDLVMHVKGVKFRQAVQILLGD